MALVVKNPPANVGDERDTVLIRGSGRSPTGEHGNPPNPLPAFLPGKSHGQRSLAGYSPRGHKELDMAEVTERATHTRLSHMTNHVSGVSGLGCFEEGEGSAEGSWGQVGM